MVSCVVIPTTAAAKSDPETVRQYKLQVELSNALDETVPLRFDVGQRVECQVGGGCWRTGTIIQQWWIRDVYLQGGKTVCTAKAPYQIRLDSGAGCVWAPEDKEHCVRISGSPFLCAGCGETGDGLKFCGACKMLKYCGSMCQLAHRSEHKAECKLRVLEVNDERLFATPPPREECPICFLVLPLLDDEWVYLTCCGKKICGGCNEAQRLEQLDRTGEPENCPFCRDVAPDDVERIVGRLERRSKENNDAGAMYLLGAHCMNGSYGLTQDKRKGFELWSKAAEFGSLEAHVAVSSVYDRDKGVDVPGVEKDIERARHHLEVAALGGYVGGRALLGEMEMKAKNSRRAVKHFMISASAGHDYSLDVVKQGYCIGDVSKDEFAKTLRAHKDSVDEMKSLQRNLFLMFRKGVPASKFTPKELKEILSSPEMPKMMAYLRKHDPDFPYGQGQMQGLEDYDDVD